MEEIGGFWVELEFGVEGEEFFVEGGWQEVWEGLVEEGVGGWWHCCILIYGYN